MEAQLGKLAGSAPMGGVILTRNIEPGEYCAAGRRGADDGGSGGLTITVYVPEDRYGQIMWGRRPSGGGLFPGDDFGAQVRQISDQAEFTPRNVQTVEGRSSTVYAIKLTVTDRRALKPGMPADVTFEASSRSELEPRSKSSHGRLKGMLPMIDARGVVKSFGDPAVDGVTLKIQAGEIYGLVGSDGAGKTTTMRMLVGALKRSGQCAIAGYDWQPNRGCPLADRLPFPALLPVRGPDGPGEHPLLCGGQGAALGRMAAALLEILEFVGLGPSRIGGPGSSPAACGRNWAWRQRWSRAPGAAAG